MCKVRYVFLKCKKGRDDTERGISVLLYKRSSCRPLLFSERRALSEGSLMRFLMSGSLKLHYDVTAHSGPPHRVIIKDNGQDEFVHPVVLVSDLKIA